MKIRRSIAALLVAPAPLLATPDSDISEEYLRDLPVVLTVSRLPQLPKELPASVTVIDREMIDASGALDVPDLLRLVAGFQVGHDNGEGVRTTVTYHGNSDNFARRMQVLVDGRSVYNPATGGVDWQDLPVALEDIRRIEVTRGPNGVTYGANSFLGVVNIITETPADQMGFAANYTRGEGDYERAYLRQAGRSGDLDYRISATVMDTPGLRDHNPKKIEEVNDGLRTSTFNLRGDWHPRANDSLTFDLGYGSGKRQRGTSDDPFDHIRNREVDFNHQQVRWEHLFSSDNELKLNLYRTFNQTADHFRSPPISSLLGIPPAAVPVLLGVPDQTIPINNDLTVERLDAELEHHFSVTDAWRVVWGTELRRDRVEGAGYFGMRGSVDSGIHRLFVNNELKPAEAWVVNLGAMLEGSDLVSDRVSPRAAVNYSFLPNHFVRASYTEAFRDPALFEAYADYNVRLDNGTLVDNLYLARAVPRPEQIRAYELALGGSFERHRVSYEVKLFKEELSDAIHDVRDPTYPDLLHNGAWLFMNGGSSETEGIETQVRANPTETSLISLALSHANTRGTLLNGVNPTEVIPTQRSTPETTASLLVSNRFPNRLRASVGLYHVSNMKWLGPGDATGSYTAADLILSQPIDLGSAKADVSLILRNLAGDYFDYRNWVYQERRAYLKLGIQF